MSDGIDSSDGHPVDPSLQRRLLSILRHKDTPEHYMLAEVKVPGGRTSKYPRVTEYDIHSVTTSSAEALGPNGVANPIGRRMLSLLGHAIPPRAY